jgi:hypothetical protein
MSTPHGPMGHVIHIDEDAYPCWKQSFPEDVRRKMVEEDVLASESIMTEMAIIIASGVLLAAGSVIAIAFFFKTA